MIKIGKTNLQNAALIAVMIILLVLVIPLFLEQTEAEKAVFQRYGIKVSSPEWRGFGYRIELIQINMKDPLCVAAKLGFRNGDLIVEPKNLSVTNFLNYLNQAPGTQTTVTVIRKEDFTPGKDFNIVNPKQVITFTLP